MPCGASNSESKSNLIPPFRRKRDAARPTYRFTKSNPYPWPQRSRNIGRFSIPNDCGNHSSWLLTKTNARPPKLENVMQGNIPQKLDRRHKASSALSLEHTSPLQANISPAERPEGGGQGGQRSVGQLGPSFFPSFTFLIEGGVLGGNRKWENFAPVTGSFYTGKRKFLYRWEIFAPIKLLERQPLLLCPYHWRFASPVEPETSTFRSEIERSKHGGGRRNPKRARQPLSPQGFVER